MKEKRCCENVVNGRSVRFRRCQRNGGFWVGTKVYCSQHYPPNVKKRHEKSLGRFREEQKIKDAPFRELDVLRDENKKLKQELAEKTAEARVSFDDNKRQIEITHNCKERNANLEMIATDLRSENEALKRELIRSRSRV